MKQGPQDSAIWPERFSPFTVSHAIVLVLFSVCTGLICSSLASRSDPVRRRAEIALGGIFLAISSAYGVWWLLPGNLDISRSLPLHVCDILSFIAPLALLTRNRRMTHIVLFCGLAFCTQAFIKPLSGPGPASPDKWPQFWGFWLTHCLIVFTSIYALWIWQIRPNTRDLWFVSRVMYVYVLAAFVLDAFFGWNYAYVGRGTQTGETLADGLGPWPIRVLWIAIAGQIALTLVLLTRLLPAPRERESLDSPA
ncbi:MAG: TIGR02206 family membrane protein [Phycisphaerales bacterium]|nr:TIGR02206 family membrane protein [Planctomycetota bacterium]